MVSLTVVSLPRDSNEVNDLISILNAQTIGKYQLVIVAGSRFTYDFIIRNEYLFSTDDYIVDYAESDDNSLLKRALALSNGDFVWLYNSGDGTSPNFIDVMSTIQRNIGADVIITDYSASQLSEVPEDGRITVYHQPRSIISRTPVIHQQWLKFFRRSLVTNHDFHSLMEFVETIVDEATIVCHYDRKMFTYNGDADRMSSVSKPIGCSWEITYSKLIKNDDFDESRIPITIGICAYNEQYNLEKAVRSIFQQKSYTFRIDSVIIVSSGSTDDTDVIIGNLAKEYDLIKPVFQKKREGKNSAVNEIVGNAATDVVVIFNADNVFASEYSLDMLVRPLIDEKVGVTGGHPIPVNSSSSLPDYTIQLMWSVHHFVSMQSPNIGELIAFRKTDLHLPTDAQGDEGLIRIAMEKKGFTTIYVPEAMVYNRGPTTVREFFNQRKRVNVGEIMIKRKTGFKHPTHNVGILINAFLSSVRQFGVRPVKAVIAVSLEYLSRLLARMYVKEHKDDLSIWDQVKTTKKL